MLVNKQKEVESLTLDVDSKYKQLEALNLELDLAREQVDVLKREEVCMRRELHEKQCTINEKDEEIYELTARIEQLVSAV